MAKTLSKAKVKKDTFKPDYDVMKKAAIVYRAVNHKTRQRILQLLDQKGEMKVSLIYQKLQLEQSLTSAYLGLLRKAGLVKTRREGQSIFYSVDYEKLKMLENFSKQLLK